MAKFVGVRIFEFGGLGNWQSNHDNKSNAGQNEKKEKGEKEGNEKRQKENYEENKERKPISRAISETSLCLVMDRFAPS
ncbi:hypothetical protein FCM35_KLT03184 [Carex littledalei]|uniref:Uncharacterized protein n=1 Tax=Carex littledalei TaxID=544730 RepID=A0A833RA56_9POAL|nr:hypothetical protein FCM35_KLT03184 [Carex littledalei]